MDIKEYWEKKADLFRDKKDFSTYVRKKIISEIMDIPYDHISSYLQGNSIYNDFLVSNADTINTETSKEEGCEDKLTKGLNIIYMDDYNIILKMAKGLLCVSDTSDSRSINNINKTDICNLIEELIKPKVLNKLSLADKETVILYEKIYFMPTELINPYVKERYSKDISIYYEHLLLQWQTANEMAANISQQRSNMNNFYMSLLTVLIGGTLFSDYFTDAIGLIIKVPLYVSISIVGVVLCVIWRKQIDNYGRLNAAKYQIINAIERELPANVLYYEFLVTEKTARKSQKKTNFYEQEKMITILFELFVLFVPMILLVGTLKGTGVWTCVKKWFSILPF